MKISEQKSEPNEGGEIQDAAGRAGRSLPLEYTCIRECLAQSEKHVLNRHCRVGDKLDIDFDLEAELPNIAGYFSKRLKYKSPADLADIVQTLREDRDPESPQPRGRAYLVIRAFETPDALIAAGTVLDVVGPVGDIESYVRAIEPANEFANNGRRSFEILFTP